MRSRSIPSFLQVRLAPRTHLTTRYAAIGLVLVLASCTASQPPSQYAAYFANGAVRGFQIQVYSTQVRADAESVVQNAESWWAAMEDQERRALFGVDYLPIDLKWLEPNYKVRIGHFRTREEARSVLDDIAEKFPAAFIVPDTLL